MSNNEQDERRIPLNVSDLPSHGLFTQAPPAELYHYTTLQGAYGIIASKQLWLTKIQYLNDTTELRYAIKLFRQTVANWPSNLDAQKRAFIDKVARQLGSFTETNICVASFCADGDVLSQWRAYGAGTKGIALGFAGSYLKELSNRGFLNTWKCVYKRSERETIIRELIDMALRCFDMRQTLRNDSAKERFTKDILGYFNTTFLRVAPVLKDGSFHEEKEWRIISAPIPTTDPNYDVVLLGARLLPLYRLDFPVAENGECTVVERIRVGPTEDVELVSNAVFALLGKHGFTGYGVQPSLIPYRAPR